jgi:nucleoside-diphosphate-sugar epimerase
MLRNKVPGMARPTTALITGVTGFVGSALARRLMAEGVRVKGLVRRRSRSDCLVELRGIEIIEVDRHDPATLRRVLKQAQPDVVYNLAAAGVVDEKCALDELLHANIELACHLTQAVAESVSATMVHAGSCFEYGVGSGEEFMRENAALRPFSIYGASKAAASLLVESIARQAGVNLITLRLFGVYGPGEAPERLAPFLIERLHRSEPADLTAGLQVRDLLYIDDVVEAFFTAAQGHEALRGQTTFNVCSGQPVTVRQVGGMLAELMNVPESLLRWGARPPRDNEPARIVGDPQRFCLATGWRPRVSLREGLWRTIEHWLARNAEVTRLAG